MYIIKMKRRYQMRFAVKFIKIEGLLNRANLTDLETL